jgi:DNA-binding Xre family transcriptional regulator
MNAVERMRDVVEAMFSEVSGVLDHPTIETGPWNLDFKREGEYLVYVEWRDGQGFGISTPKPDDFGSKPDEYYRDEAQALARVAHLIRTGQPSTPPAAVQLAELRKLRGMTQSQLAGRSGLEQTNVSRLERQGDWRIGTLSRYLRALDCKVSVQAILPDGTSLELRFTEEEPTPSDLPPAGAVERSEAVSA